MPPHESRRTAGPTTLAQWEQIVERLPHCVAIYSAVRDQRDRIVDFRVEYVNEAACRSHRLARDEQIGQRLNDLLPGHRESGLFGAYCEVVDTGKTLVRTSFEHSDLYGDRIETHVLDITAERYGDGVVVYWNEASDDDHRLTPPDRVTRSGSGLARQSTVAPDGADATYKSDSPAVRDDSAAPMAIASNDDRKFEAVVKALPAAIYTCDGQGRILMYNDAAADLWGRRPEIGRDLWCGSWKIFHPADASPMPLDQCPMAITIRENRAIHGEEILVEQPNGNRRNVLAHPQPIRDASGRLIGAINMLVDITERNRTAAALRESEERFRLMADAAPVLIWVSDSRKRGIYFNERWLEFTGRTHDQEVGHGWIESIHPADRERVNAICLAAFERFEPFRMEFRMRRADGVYRWILDHGVPRFTDHGQLAGYIGSCIDVTDRRQAEVALRHERARLEAVLQQLPVGVVIAEAPSGRPILVNEQLNRLWRRSFNDSENLHDQPGVKGFHPDEREYAPEEWPLSRTISTGETVEQEEIEIERGDGQYGWVAVSSAPIYDSDDSIVASVVTFTDITERKHHEEQMRIVMSELNHRVKNTLAVIQSIARQTVRRSPDLATFMDSFEQRLHSIAAAHSLLTRSEWEGASLSEIISNVVGPRVASDSQCRIDGPPVMLRPKAALALHMVIHELGTNASKHGALRSDAGRLDVQWGIVGDDRSADELELRWTERATVTAPPSSDTGYGTRLIEQLVEYELTGAIERDLQPDGLQFRLRMPLGMNSTTSATGRRPNASSAG